MFNPLPGAFQYFYGPITMQTKYKEQDMSQRPSLLISVQTKSQQHQIKALKVECAGRMT